VEWRRRRQHDLERYAWIDDYRVFDVGYLTVVIGASKTAVLEAVRAARATYSGHVAPSRA
jgi:hypothetical protein